jgi:hypothetical protein
MYRLNGFHGLVHGYHQYVKSWPKRHSFNLGTRTNACRSILYGTSCHFYSVLLAVPNKAGISSRAPQVEAIAEQDDSDLLMMSTPPATPAAPPRSNRGGGLQVCSLALAASTLLIKVLRWILPIPFIQRNENCWQACIWGMIHPQMS